MIRLRRGSKRAAAIPTQGNDGDVAVAVGPAGVDVLPSMIRVGDGWAATLIVTGYPTEVGLAWLDALLSWPGRLDAAMHIEPMPAVTAANRLKRQRARLESSRRLDADKGRLGDPTTDAAAEDAADLAERLARGQVRLFRVGLYLTVHAPTQDDLIQAAAEVRAAAASVLLDTQPATWRQLQGWTSTLPLGHDGLGMRRVFDTDALAMAFPLGSADVPAPLPGQAPPPGGVLYGHNSDSAGIVWWDRWSQHNHNSVILARSGAGKSYLIKLEILRSLYDLIAVAVIDPEDEYPRLAKAIGGTIARLGAPGVRLNPFDIPTADRQRDALVRRQLFLHTLISVLLAEPVSPAVLDKAVNATYAAAAINHDPATWNRPAPLLRDLAATLAASTDPQAQLLADRLSPWTHGSFKDLFDGPSTVTPTGQLVVWSTRLLPDELRPAGMLLALDAIWRDVDAPTSTTADLRDARPPQVQRRLVVVDEAWTLLRDGQGAKFLNRLAKAARKRHAGLSVVTQDAADVLGSDLGRAVVSNAATQILMRQAPQAIEAITNAFALTAGEARVLLAAGKGQGLLLGGSLRCGFQVVASPREHLLCATGVADMGEPDGDEHDAAWAA
jgi:type IV secretory pathway VirB4 component